MDQVHTPSINTQASPGMCLGYIDDAGNAPQRSQTAKAAFLKEQAAGRITFAELPENVWVVVWFSFSRGSYTYPNGSTVQFKDAWHVAFIRRRGNSVEIHDSEVHSGARQPYTALAAVEAWFAAYGAKCVGWSPQCDGRIYAKTKQQGEDIMRPSEASVRDNIVYNVGREPTNKAEIDFYTSKDARDLYYNILRGLYPSRSDVEQAFNAAGLTPSAEQLEYYPARSKWMLYQDLFRDVARRIGAKPRAGEINRESALKYVNENLK